MNVAEYQMHPDWGEQWICQIVDAGCGKRHYLAFVDPTHWMPLPDPPGDE